MPQEVVRAPPAGSPEGGVGQPRAAAREARYPGIFGLSKQDLFRTIIQSVGIFLFVQFAIKNFIQPSPTESTTGGAASPANMPIPAYASRPNMNELDGQYNSIPQNVAPIWPSDTSFDISVYVSPSLVMPSLKSMPVDSLVLQEKGLLLGDWKVSKDVHARFTVPKEVQNNGTLWAHIYVAQSGAPLDPTATYYDSAKGYHFVRPLTQYLPRKKVKKTRNLLAGKETKSEEEDVSLLGVEVASYYHPNFTMSFIPDAGIQPYPQVHPGAREWIQLEATGARDASGQNGWYYPIVFLNTFWQLRSHLEEVNSTVTTLPLNIHINSLAHWKFNLITSMDYGMKQKAQEAAEGKGIPGAGGGGEFEMVKQVLLDSNIYLLVTTIIVSLLHSVFELLAFKNDLSHWRKKKDNIGVSVRTIIANVFMQSIIFLYLIDNTENTSWMILFGQGMGIALEAWKVTKAVDVRIRRTPNDSRHWFWQFSPYTITFEDKHKLSEVEKQTQEYDEIAFKYLYMVAVPLLLAYAVYSLKYDTHTSWYSYSITTLVGSVYAYGFLMMIPSLYINYRLKSVAHMPGKAMTYKVLGTFVDDLVSHPFRLNTDRNS